MCEEQTQPQCCLIQRHKGHPTVKYNQGLCAQVKSIPSGVCGMVFGKSKQFFSPDFYIEMRQGSGVFPSLTYEPGCEK